MRLAIAGAQSSMALARLLRRGRVLRSIASHSSSIASRCRFVAPPFSLYCVRAASSVDVSSISHNRHQSSQEDAGARDAYPPEAQRMDEATWRAITDDLHELTPDLFAHGLPPELTASDSYVDKWKKLIVTEFHASLSAIDSLGSAARVNVELLDDERVLISGIRASPAVSPADLPKTLLKTKSGWLYITSCDPTSGFPVNATAVAYDKLFERVDLQSDPGNCVVFDTLAPLLYRFNALRVFQTQTHPDIRKVIDSGDIFACEPHEDVLLPVAEDARGKSKLNASQFNVLKNVRMPVDFVQGPPGTGKSTFIVQYVKMRLPSTDDSRVLICAATNKAIDSLTEKLAAAGCGEKLLAVGSSRRLGATSTRFSIESRAERHKTVLAFDRKVVNAKALVALREEYQAAVDAHTKALAANQRSDPQATEEFDFYRYDASHAAEMDDVALNLHRSVSKVKASSASFQHNELVPKTTLRAIESARVAMHRASTGQLMGAIRNYEAVLQNAAVAVRAEVGRSIILEARYFVCTAAVAATLPDRLYDQISQATSGSRRIKPLTFEHVILDEAGSMLEPDVVGTIVHGCRSLLMVGDHRQLPPFTKWQWASSHNYDVSLMMRLSQNASTTHNMITTQYRMHPQLADIVSSQFYGNGLQTALSTKRSRTRRWPVVLVDVKGEEERRGTSYLNRREIAAVVELVKRERAANPTQTVSVICFHRPQYKAIHRALVTRGLLDEKDATQSSGGPQPPSSLPPTLDVSTVDAMQGREADVVILSCVRTHEHDVGFLASDNRVNVALSRAKQVLYVVGDATALSTNATWRGVLQHQHIMRDTRAGLV